MSWSGAMSGAITGAQIGAQGGFWGIAAGAALGGAAGGLSTLKSDEEKSIEAFYKQLSQGVSRQEAAQRISIAESKAEAAAAEERATQVKRGGVSSAAGGTSGVAMTQALQAGALARRARSEALGKEQKSLGEQDIQMKIAGMQGMAAIEQQKKLDQEKAMNLLITSDIGADTLKKTGAGLKNIFGEKK